MYDTLGDCIGYDRFGIIGYVEIARPALGRAESCSGLHSRSFERGLVGRVLVAENIACVAAEQVFGGKVDYKSSEIVAVLNGAVESLIVGGLYLVVRSGEGGKLLKLEVVDEHPAVGEGSVRSVGCGLGARSKAVIGFGNVVGRAVRTEPYSHIVVEISELVALNVEGICSPTVCACAVHGAVVVARAGSNSGRADKIIGGGVGGDTLDFDILAVAACKDKRNARAVYAVGVKLYGNGVGFIFFDGDSARGANALSGHKLLREHKRVCAYSAVNFLNVLCDSLEACRGLVLDIGGVVSRSRIVGRGEVRISGVKLRQIDNGVIAERGRSRVVLAAVSRHERPGAGRVGGGKSGGAEVKATVGNLESSSSNKFVAVPLLVLGGVELLFSVYLGGLVVVLYLFKVNVVKESVAGGQALGEIGVVLAKSEHYGKACCGGGRGFDINLIGLPLALGIYAAELRVGVGAEVDARSALLLVLSADVVSKHVYGKLVIGALVKREARGRITVSGRSVYLVAVRVLTLLGHIYHKRVFDFIRVAVVSAVSVELLPDFVVIVLPLGFVGVVGIFIHTYNACGNVVPEGAVGVHLCTRPTGNGAGIGLDGCVYDLKIAVVDEQSLGSLNLRVIVAVRAAVRIAGEEQAGAECEYHNHQ